MALLRDIVYKAGPTTLQLIAQEAESLNLKIVRKLMIRFDPFREDVKDIRDFSYFIHKTGKISNPRLIIKSEVLSDRSEQSLTFELTDGKKFIFKCGNLKCLEIFQLINQHITPLSPVEESTAAALPSLKGTKGKGAYDKGGKGKVKGKK